MMETKDIDNLIFWIGLVDERASIEVEVDNAQYWILLEVYERMNE